MNISSLTTNVLLLYFLLFFAFGFAWRSWRVYRQTGTWPLVLPKTDDVPGYVGRAFKLQIAALGAYLLCLAALGGTPLWAGPLTALTHPTWAALGWGLLALALPLLILAQRDMGASWRIGVDEKTQPVLVTQGLFARSRNPIFLAMRLALAGLVLTSPTAVALGLGVLGEVLIQVQVRLEEAYMHTRLGDDYARYQTRVARWW